MRAISEIDIFADAGLRRDIARLSGRVLAIGGVAVGLALALSGEASAARIGLGALIACLATLAALPVHELVHGAAFKLLGGRGRRVSFGHKDAFLYTRFQGPPLPKGRFVAVLLAPTVALTLALPALGSAGGWPLAGWAAAVLHLSGCTGDLLMARDILATPGVTHVEDTGSGCRLLG